MASVASAGTANPQIRFGEDLMSRISYLMMNPNDRGALTDAKARALASDPALLLLDEPTAGMSATETHDTIHLIEKIASERALTLLFTEHDMAVVFQIAQKIAVLHQGRLIADGTPQEVRADAEVRRVYLGEH